jgi:hypothetical protein
MLWLLVLVIIGLLIGSALLLPWAWGEPLPTPPPEVTPLITSAVGTSAHTIHLTLQKGVGPVQVELERTRPPDPSKFSFFSMFDEVDDNDLERDTPYRYRARYITPPSAWSPSKDASTLMLFDVLNAGQLTIPDSGWEGYCLVQRFEAGVLSHSGGQVSL